MLEKIVRNYRWIEATKAWAIKIAITSEEELDNDGGLWHEKGMGCLVGEKHWWPQAEAMIGFLNAWELNGTGE